MKPTKLILMSLLAVQLSYAGEETVTVAKFDKHISFSSYNRISAESRAQAYARVKEVGFTYTVSKGQVNTPAEEMRDAAGHMLSDQYFSKSNTSEVIKVAEAIAEMISPLDYEEGRMTITRERDLRIERRVNKDSALRRDLVVILGQLVQRYKAIAPEVVTDNVLNTLEKVAKYDYLSHTRRIATLTYITATDDKSKKVALLNHVKNNDGKIIFNGEYDRHNGASYEFIHAEVGENGQFVLNYKSILTDLPPVERLKFDCDYWEGCEAYEGDVVRMTSEERLDKVYEALNSLPPQIDIRKQVLSNPKHIHGQRLLAKYMQDLNAEIDELNDAIDRYIEKHGEAECSSGDYWRNRCLQLKRRLERVEKTKLQVAGSEVPERHMNRLDDMIDGLKSERLAKTGRYKEASNGVTVVLAWNTRAYATEWLQRIDSVKFYETLKEMARKRDLGDRFSRLVYKAL